MRLTSRQRIAVFVVGLLGGAVPASARADTMESCVQASLRGQQLRDTHHLIEARSQFLSCASEACPHELSKECVRWLDDVTARMPTVSISARDEDGRDVVDVRVVVDGKLLLAKLDGAATPVDPGEHVFRYEPRTSAAVEEHVLVREGETNRLLTVHVRNAAPAVARAAPVFLSTIETEPRARPISAPTFVLAGVGVVGVGAFAFFAATAKGKLSDLRDTCGATQSCSQGDVDAVHRDTVIANVALGVGVIALAGALWLFLQRPAAPTQTAGRSSPL
ncbi:MAG: hypothetical protein JWO86_1361 [Myxococcaceae bacterium]|nr:hypothetical protein [Myxococcaceae bacterium]